MISTFAIVGIIVSGIILAAFIPTASFVYFFIFFLRTKTGGLLSPDAINVFVGFTIIALLIDIGTLKYRLWWFNWIKKLLNLFKGSE